MQIDTIVHKNLNRGIDFDSPSAQSYSGWGSEVSSTSSHDSPQYGSFGQETGECALEMLRPKLLDPPMPPSPRVWRV